MSGANQQSKKVRTRLQGEVNDRRNPRTSATVNTLPLSRPITLDRAHEHTDGYVAAQEQLATAQPSSSLTEHLRHGWLDAADQLIYRCEPTGGVRDRLRSSRVDSSGQPPPPHLCRRVFQWPEVGRASRRCSPHRQRRQRRCRWTAGPAGAPSAVRFLQCDSGGPVLRTVTGSAAAQSTGDRTPR
jgi:hypothetical protein